MFVAQQLIDASEDGGAAFLVFAIMVFLFAASLFYMDRVRSAARGARPQRAVHARHRRASSAQRGRGFGGGVDRLLDVGVGVGEAREQRLVAARREEHAAVEQAVEERARSARGRRPGRRRSRAPGASAKNSPTSVHARGDLRRDAGVGERVAQAVGEARRPCASSVGVGGVVELREHGEAGRGGERVPARACRPGTRGRAARARP